MQFQVVPEPEICHGIQSFIAGKCAYPDTMAITNLSLVQELGKNRDKQLNLIVRVWGCLFCFISYGVGRTVNLVRFPGFFNFNNNCFCYPVMNRTSIIINKILQKSKTKF
jgi:hypothetical protein